MKSKEGYKSIIYFLLFVWLLNVVWEVAHGLLYAGYPTMSAINYIPLMLHCSLIDTLLIAGIALVSGFFVRKYDGFIKGNKISMIVFIIISLIAAVFIEYRAVYMLGKWSYGIFMPTIAGIGITPLIQLAVTGLVSLYLVLFMKGGRS